MRTARETIRPLGDCAHDVALERYCPDCARSAASELEIDIPLGAGADR